MSEIKDGGPAFPSGKFEPGGRDILGKEFPPKIINTGGMSLRDWFAGMAMQILLQHGTEAFPQFKDIAAETYRFADAMIAEREKRP